MPKKRYKITDKVKANYNNQRNWERRLEILRLSMQGWTQSQIARKVGVSRQWISTIIERMGNLTVEEAEKLANQSNLVVDSDVE